MLWSRILANAAIAAFERPADGQPCHAADGAGSDRSGATRYPAAMPKASFTHHAAITRTADMVWDRLQIAATWSNIGPVEQVWDEEHNDVGHLVQYRWSTTVGPKTYRGKANVIASEPGRLMRLALDAGEIVGTLTTALSANGDGSTHLEVTLEIVSRGALSTMFFPVVADVVGRGLPSQVERFAEAFETE